MGLISLCFSINLHTNQTHGTFVLKAALPANENARLEALHSLCVLDTPQSDRFDRLTRTAARLFKTPVALVTLVDEHRQWFKSAYGLDATETIRDLAFCAHAILDDDVFVVLDATKNPKFADNPLVTDALHIRFYAGAQLISPDGMKLGTFCIVDHVPRTEFNNEDRAALKDLAAAAMDQLIIEKSLGATLVSLLMKTKTTCCSPWTMCTAHL